MLLPAPRSLEGAAATDCRPMPMVFRDGSTAAAAGGAGLFGGEVVGTTAGMRSVAALRSDLLAAVQRQEGKPSRSFWDEFLHLHGYFSSRGSVRRPPDLHCQQAALAPPLRELQEVTSMVEATMVSKCL